MKEREKERKERKKEASREGRKARREERLALQIRFMVIISPKWNNFNLKLHGLDKNV